MWVWVPLMLVTLVLLLLAERQAAPDDTAHHSAERHGRLHGVR